MPTNKSNKTEDVDDVFAPIRQEFTESLGNLEGALTTVLTKSSKELSGNLKELSVSVERKIDEGVNRALLKAKEDRAWYQKPTVQLAAGAAVLGVGAYFIHSNRQKSKAALGMASNNTKFLSSLGAESTEDGIALLNVSKIGR